MTSLSSQLKSLQIPDELSVLNIQNKRASILFDAHDAADIDLDTVFSLGLSGLTELENIDPEFSKFEKMLFSANVKGLERTQQPAELNKKLDTKIEEFLTYLSPYFLIKPAQKALEWLIRRFRIHVFNVDALMSCILPYHETNLFSRVLQILTLSRQNGKWEWLLPVQKSASPLSKLTLIQHCVHNMAFQNFICEMVPQAIEIREGRPAEKLKTLISFYASVLLGVVDASQNLTEGRVGKILPFVYKGLKSNIDDYKASSYMILSKLCWSVTFEEQIVIALVEQLCKSLTGETAQFGILTMEYLYRTQNTNKFPTKALKKLCSSEENLQHVLKTSEANDISSFQTVFLSASVNYMMISTQSDTDAEQRSVNYESVTRRCLQSMDLKAPATKLIMRNFFEHFIKLREMSTNLDPLMAASQRLMKLFETRFPEATDAVIKEFLNKPTRPSELEWIEALIFGGLKSTKYTILPETRALLSVSLNHPDPERRKHAVRELIKKSDLEESQGNLEYARDALMSRLNDDDISVFEEVLAGGSATLRIVGNEALIKCLLQKLTSMPFSERTALVGQILEIFKNYDFDSEDCNTLICELVPSIIPSVLHIKPQLALYKNLSDSCFASKHPIIAGIRSAVKTCDLSKLAEDRSLIHELYIRILENISEILSQNDLNKEMIKPLLQFAQSVAIDHPYRSFLFSLLFKLLDRISAVDIGFIIHQLEELIRSAVEVLATIEGKTKHVDLLLHVSDSEPTFAELAKLLSSKKQDSRKEKDRFPRINMFCMFLEKVLDKGKVLLDVPLQQFLFEALAAGSGKELKNRPYVMVFRRLLQKFLKGNFAKSTDLLYFLLTIFSDEKRFDWLTSEQPSFDKIEVQACALHIFKVFLENLSKSPEFILAFASEALPILLVLLHHPLKIMREASVGCIQVLNDINADKIDSGLKYLLNFIVSCDTEIVEDMNQIQRVLEKLFKPLNNTASDAEMLEPAHLEDLRLLTKYLSGFILSSKKHIKLGIATVSKTVVFQEFLVHLLPALEDVIQLAQTTGLPREDFLLLRILLQKFDVSTVDVFQKYPPSLKLFTTALELGKICQRSSSTVQAIALEQISPSFYSSIASSKTQNEIFDTLLCSAITTSSMDVSKAVREKFTQLHISAEDVARQILAFKEQLEEAQPKKAKRSRRMTKSKVINDVNELVDSIAWNRIIILLEIMQQKADFESNERLIVSLFDMLSCCLELTSASQSSAEYMKQLLLSSLQRSLESIIASGNKGGLAQDKFSIASVIQCCRTSENPQTHHQALLLLGKAAHLFPDLVLHNIMTIFTFMGASVLRQDDSYSFEIIKKTIDSVIPTLVMAGSSKAGSEAQQQQTNDVVKLVVRVFVDAVPYIPEHRRLILFQHLSTVLNSEKNLYIVVAILLEKLVSQSQKKEESDAQVPDDSSLSLDFCQLLIRQFPAQIVVKTIENLVHFVSNLADAKKEDLVQKTPARPLRSQKIVTGELVPLFDLTKYSAKEVKQFKYSVVTYVSGVLSEESFVDEALNKNDKEMEDIYLRLLEEIMNFVCKLGKTVEKHAKDSSVKFWKALLHRGCELIEKVYKLLRFDSFVNVTAKLVCNENPTIRKKAIELIAEKITTVINFSYEELLQLTGNLVDISKHDSQETPINKQTALYALKFLIRVLSANHAAELVRAVPIVTEAFAADNANQQVSASALLCLAELCGCLGVRIISLLPEFMPPVLKVFDRQENRNDLVVLSSLTVLHKSVESISKFLSPYLVKILDIVTRVLLGPPVASTEPTRTNSVRGQISAKGISLRQDVAKMIPPRVLLPALDACLDDIINSEQHSFQSFMDITQHAMEAISREDTKTYSGKILSFFLKTLDVRCLYSEKSQQELEELEGSVVNAFCTLTMKLSENIFRPMFLKISTWAATSDKHRDRLLTFYRLCGAIADKLKGLFLLFAGHIVKPCAELIRKCYTDKEDCGVFDSDIEFKTDLLMRLIFDCLQKCFLNDSQGFLNKERFEYLLAPLVDQIENPLGGNAVYTARIADSLIPCVTSFAADISEEAGWKTLNYQILLKTRSPNSQVRLSALKLLEQIHKRIGEGYMVLLPESIPFLAELMEDEDFEVEKQCQLVIAQMEGILGESLQKYF